MHVTCCRAAGGRFCPQPPGLAPLVACRKHAAPQQVSRPRPRPRPRRQSPVHPERRPPPGRRSPFTLGEQRWPERPALPRDRAGPGRSQPYIRTGIGGWEEGSSWEGGFYSCVRGDSSVFRVLSCVQIIGMRHSCVCLMMQMVPAPCPEFVM